MQHLYNNLNNMRKFIILFVIVSVVGMLAFSGCDFGDTYTITFDANGGTGVMDPQTFTGSVNKALTLNNLLVKVMALRSGIPYQMELV